MNPRNRLIKGPKNNNGSFSKCFSCLMLFFDPTTSWTCISLNMYLPSCLCHKYLPCTWPTIDREGCCLFSHTFFDGHTVLPVVWPPNGVWYSNVGASLLQNLYNEPVPRLKSFKNLYILEKQYVSFKQTLTDLCSCKHCGIIHSKDLQKDRLSNWSPTLSSSVQPSPPPRAPSLC